MVDEENYLSDEVFENDKKKRRNSIIVCLVILMIAGGFIFSYLSAQNTQQRLQETRLNALSTAKELDDRLLPYATLMTNLAKDPAVQGMLVDDTLKIQGTQVFEHMLATDPNISYLYLGTEDHQMIMRPDDELPSGYDPTGRPWYVSAKEANALLWTDSYRDSSTGKTMTSLAIPVLYQDAFGVLGADLYLDKATEMLQIPMGEHSFSFLLDRSNVIIAFPSDRDGNDLHMTGKILQHTDIFNMILSADYSNTRSIQLDLNEMARPHENSPPDILDYSMLANLPQFKKCYATVTPLKIAGWHLVSIAW